MADEPTQRHPAEGGPADAEPAFAPAIDPATPEEAPASAVEPAAEAAAPSAEAAAPSAEAAAPSAEAAAPSAEALPPDEPASTDSGADRAPRSMTGVVVSSKADKTISVRIERRVKHPVYGKFVRRSTKLAAHDQNNDCQEGDVVTILETRPISKNKSWRLASIVERASAVGRGQG